MEIEKERSWIIHILYMTMICLFVYIFFRYVIYEILPFLLGFMIAFMLRPAVRSTKRIISLPQKLVSLCYLVLFYGTIGTGIVLLCMKCFHFLSLFVISIPSLYETQIAPMLTSLLHHIDTEFSHLSPEVKLQLNELLLSMSDSMRSFAISMSSHVFQIITSIASSLPSMIVSFFITLLSSIFFSLDFPDVSRFIMRQVPQNHYHHLYRIREIISKTCLNYLGAYGKLMMITWIELFIGLSYLGVENAISIAFLISFFDIFPILGTGTILYPWMLISFFNHRLKFAVGLLILHLIINVLRQFIEPKIVGKQMGIHPLFMLACMFFGIKLFGFLGIFIAPILLQIICRLNEEGFLHLYH